MDADQKPHLDLSVRRLINATPERLFRAWTEVDELLKWFGPGEVVLEFAEVDLRIGGEYRFDLKTPDGKSIVHHGVYREIHANKKLVFTWVLDGQDCAGSKEEDCETVVTVFFHEHDGATELVVIHDFLPSENSRDNHGMGWKGCLDCLEKMLAQTA